VTVTTPNGTSGISSHDHFTFGQPTVTDVSPNAGPKAGGTSITVTGTGFGLGATATHIKFGSIPATSIGCASTTTCVLAAPAHRTGTVAVKVIVGGKTSANNPPADQFIYK
jgi:hypothetical protein